VDRLPLVGVIPGGGGARRLAELPFSKELLPVGFRNTESGPRPRLVCEYLLDGLTEAGVDRVLWLLDRSKTDVIQRFGRGEPGPLIAYVTTDASPSVLHTLDAGYPLLQGCRVVFGFPDIVMDPGNCLSELVQRLGQTAADVALAAFPAPPEQVADRIRTDASGRVEEVRVKGDGAWPLAWAAAAWAPSFGDFLHDWLATEADEATDVMSTAGSSLAARRELYLGHAVQAAIEAGLHVAAVPFESGSFIDTGTPRGLASALARYGTTLP
jgi:glucose-1-phosphate thymidylyltransferase